LDQEFSGVEDTLPSGDPAGLSRADLQPVPAEQIVLLAVWAIGTAQAANQQHRNPNCHENGE
jgi:hypothetical protein